MKPKPLHRSITFGSGIILMLFIAWAWWDSMVAVSHLQYLPYRGRSGAGAVLILNFAYGDHVAGREPTTRNPHWGPFPPAFFRRGGGDRRFVRSPADAGFRQSIEQAMTTKSSDEWVMIIPYWLLLLAVILPWSGMLIWRARRIRRAKANEVP